MLDDGDDDDDGGGGGDEQRHHWDWAGGKTQSTHTIALGRCDFEENDDDDEKRQERKDGRVRVYMSSEFPPREIQVWVCGCVCVFPPVSCSLFD